MESRGAEYLDLQAKAKAIRSEYRRCLNSGNVPRNKELYEEIASLSQELEHRLDCAPQEITRLTEKLKRAIASLETGR
jgi:hypothetical protein